MQLLTDNRTAIAYKGFIPSPLDRASQDKLLTQCHENLDLFKEWYIVLLTQHA